jgi:hypothetical protein
MAPLRRQPLRCAIRPPKRNGSTPNSRAYADPARVLRAHGGIRLGPTNECHGFCEPWIVHRGGRVGLGRPIVHLRELFQRRRRLLGRAWCARTGSACTTGYIGPCACGLRPLGGYRGRQRSFLGVHEDSVRDDDCQNAAPHQTDGADRGRNDAEPLQISWRLGVGHAIHPAAPRACQNGERAASLSCSDASSRRIERHKDCPSLRNSPSTTRMLMCD